jgi:hypothetical protein
MNMESDFAEAGWGLGGGDETGRELKQEHGE